MSDQERARDDAPELAPLHDWAPERDAADRRAFRMQLEERLEKTGRRWPRFAGGGLAAAAAGWMALLSLPATNPSPAPLPPAEVAAPSFLSVAYFGAEADAAEDPLTEAVLTDEYAAIAQVFEIDLAFAGESGDPPAAVVID